MAKNNVTVENWLKNVNISCQTPAQLEVAKKLADNAFYRMKLLDIPGFNSVLKHIKAVNFLLNER